MSYSLCASLFTDIEILDGLSLDSTLKDVRAKLGDEGLGGAGHLSLYFHEGEEISFHDSDKLRDIFGDEETCGDTIEIDCVGAKLAEVKIKCADDGHGILVINRKGLRISIERGTTLGVHLADYRMVREQYCLTMKNPLYEKYTSVCFVRKQCQFSS